MTRSVHTQKYPETRPLRLSAGDTVLVRSLSTHRGLKVGHEAWVTASTADLDELVKGGFVELVGQEAKPKAKAAARKPAAKKSAKKRAPAKKAAAKKAGATSTKEPASAAASQPDPAAAPSET